MRERNFGIEPEDTLLKSSVVAVCVGEYYIFFPDRRSGGC